MTIAFNPNFVAVKQYPGYFWHVVEEQLYSIKSGRLKKIKMYSANRWITFGDYYIASQNSRKRYLAVDRLKKLQREQYELPY